MFPALFPNPDLLLTSIPLNNNTHMIRLAHLIRILGVHGTRLALELGVSEAHNITGPDLVVRLRRCVGEIGVDKSAVCACGHWRKGIGIGLEKFFYEAMRSAVANDGVLLAFDRFGDLAAELLVSVFELVGALAGWRWRVLLLELDIGHV